MRLRGFVRVNWGMFRPLRALASSLRPSDNNVVSKGWICDGAEVLKCFFSFFLSFFVYCFFYLQTVVYKLLDVSLWRSLVSLAVFLQIRHEVISVLLISSQSGKCGKLHLWSAHVWEMKAEGVKAFLIYIHTHTHVKQLCQELLSGRWVQTEPARHCPPQWKHIFVLPVFIPHLHTLITALH